MSYSPTYSFFAVQVYESGLENNEVGDFAQGVPDQQQWKIIEAAEDIEIGFQAAAYMNQVTHEVVIAYRGSDDVQDWVQNNLAMGFGYEPPQYQAALAFYNRVQVNLDIAPDTYFTIVGHSLGGALAQMIGVETGTLTQTFNGFGAGLVIENMGLTPVAGGEDYSNITNHVENQDLVSHLPQSKQIGKTISYESTNELAYNFWWTQFQSADDIATKSMALLAIKAYEAIAHSSLVFTANAYALASSEGTVVGVADGSAYNIVPSVELVSLMAAMETGIISFGHKVGDAVSEYFQQAMTVARYVDPLVLDMDGDGVETVGENSTSPLMFDMTASGVKQSVGWVAPDDGLLVLDRNGNGAIDSGAELFGDATTLSTGEKAADGFEALSDLDSNSDGVISSADDAYSSLKVWRDTNQDGISQASELVSLSAAGVASLNLAGLQNLTALENGNQIGMVGTYTKSDGTEGTLGAVHSMGDVNFEVNPFISQFTDSIPILESMQDIPNLQGSGMVRSLREAASLQTPEGDALRTAITAYLAETTRAGQISKLDALVKAWADTSTMATTATGAFEAAGVDLNLTFSFVVTGSAEYQEWSNKLAIVERFNGTTLTAIPEAGTTFNLEIFNSREWLLNDTYNALKDSVYAAFAFETRLRPYLDSVSVSATAEGVTFDFTAMEAMLASKYATSPVVAFQDRLDLLKYSPEFATVGWDGWQTLYSWATSLQESGLGQDILSGLDSSFLHAATSGDDVHFMTGSGTTFNGGEGNDLIIGSNLASAMHGGAGEDTLVSGTGNEVLLGGQSGDTYVFNLGFGVDKITEGGVGVDVVRFGDGILPADISLSTSFDGLDLIVSHANGEDVLTLENYFYWTQQNAIDSPSNFKIEKFEFADGTVWDAAALATGAVITGTAADDYINVSSQSGTALVIEAGAGNDTIDGSGFAATYHFNLGGGADIIRDGTGGDTIIFGEGILASDITLSTSLNGKDLILAHSNGTDRITLQNYFYSSLSDYKVDQVKFADGTIWDAATLSTGAVITGTAGNDIIYGADDSTPTTIAGGSGNDTIYGTFSGDTYHFNLGDGVDTITDYGTGVDTIKLGAGVLPGDIALSASFNGRDLILSHSNGADKITLVDFFYTGSAYPYKIESIQFADGTVWDSAKLATGAVITGSAANDTLTAASGVATTIQGNAGNDTISGSSGNDTYIFNRGDGADTITDYGPGVDKIKFGENIAPADVTLTTALNGRDLVLKIAGSSDQITVTKYFYGGSTYDYRIESVEFADGTVWTSQQLAAAVQFISGTDGNDTITSPSVAGAIIAGGKGNDTIYGSSLSNVYIFNLGDGVDTIRDYGTGIDALQMGDGISPADITMSLSMTGRDLILSHANGTDKVTMVDFFYNYGYGYKIESVQFADGPIWDAAKLATGAVITGTAGNDTITAAHDGTATTITGGMGNDTIYGTSASDTYFFNLGDGSDTIKDYGAGFDTIKLGAGITPADITMATSLNGRDLILSHSNGTDKITLKDFFYNYGAGYKIEAVQFADGTVWDAAKLATGAVITGTAGNDSITAANDGTATTITGGAGNDTISATTAGDTFIYNLGDGADTISEPTTGKGVDTLKFSEGIKPSDLAVSFVNSDLIITLPSGTDKITVKNYFAAGVNGGNPMIDSFQFADGTSVTSADMTAAAKGKNGTTANDALTGSALNDKIYGLGGNDTLTGGAGNDLLVGGVGSDTYVLGRGVGQDIIDNTTADATVGKQDTVQYSADVSSDQLWFQHVGSDLIVSVIGTTDKVSIQNWYGSSANHVQQFVAGDGKVLSESQVEQLVSAMAGFAPPPQGQTTLPQNYQEQLAPTLAANWQ